MFGWCGINGASLECAGELIDDEGREGGDMRSDMM